MPKLPLAATAISAVAVAGLLSIQDDEGLRLKTYRDPVGIPTVCWGHTGPDVRMGQTWSRKRCEQVFYQDLVVHAEGLNRCIKVKLNPNQAVAVLSLGFNVGVEKVCNSTLVRKLNEGDFAGASLQFRRWIYAGNKVLPGLVKRRAREQSRFDAPVLGDPETLSLSDLKKLVSA